MDIIIERSRIIVQPYQKGLSPSLEKKLSLFDPTNWTYKDQLFLINSIERKLFIPRGIGVDDVMMSLENDGIYGYKVQDNTLTSYTEPRKVDIVIRPHIEIRDRHQQESIKFLTRDEVPQRFLNIDTGFGKTFCSTAATAYYKYTTLILVHSSALMLQWERVIKEYTFVPKDKIITLQGSDSVERIMKKPAKHIFYICSIHTFSILAQEFKLEAFIEHIKCGVRITDEAHRLYVANAYIDMMSNIKYNIYLTATPTRSDDQESQLYFRITKTIPKFGEYTVELNRHADVKNVYINTYPSGWEQIRAKTKQGFSAIKYEDFIFKNPRRRLYFIMIAKRLVEKLLDHDPDAKILILMAKNDNIKVMAEALEQRLGIKIGTFTSLINKPEKKREQLTRNVIISTVLSSGDGLDLKGLRAIIVFVPFRSPVTLHQLIGRLRRIEGKALYYFNIIDEGYNDCVRQANVRNNQLRKKAKSITNMELPMSLVFEGLGENETS